MTEILRVFLQTWGGGTTDPDLTWRSTPSVMRVPLQHCLLESKPYDKYVGGRCVWRQKRSCNRLKLRWQAWGSPVGEVEM